MNFNYAALKFGLRFIVMNKSLCKAKAFLQAFVNILLGGFASRRVVHAWTHEEKLSDSAVDKTGQVDRHVTHLISKVLRDYWDDFINDCRGVWKLSRYLP